MTDPGADAGQPKPRRIRIKVPEAYKRVNDEVWEDLETYLFTGFITSPALVLGKSFVFKSLNHHELKNIQFLRPSHGSASEVRSTYRAAIIAYSTLVIDGQSALVDRPRSMAKLIRAISKIPADIQEKLSENLSALNTRAYRLHPLTEIYVHENRSRFRWMQIRGTPIHSPMITGIPGTDHVGMNYCQSTWTALNQLMDRREEMERSWSEAKFIGSCFNSKGVRSVDERDRARHEKERSDLEDLRMRVLYRYLNRSAGPDDEPQAHVQLPDGRMATVEKKFQADTIEELADQLSAALSGEKDFHDTVVEQHQAKMKERASVLEGYQRGLYSMPAIEAPETSVPVGGTTSRILGGKEEAEARLARMQALRIQNMEKMRDLRPTDLDETSDKATDGGNPED
jgi:hypothetical protein